MLKGLLIFLLLFSAFCGYSQTFRFDNALPVINENQDTLRLAWAGGINSPQYNSTDLNNDGAADLVLFDRTSNRLLTFIKETNGTYTHAPEFEAQFPAGLRNWVILRDYNCDGRMDIFTSAQFGIRVYTNVSLSPNNLQWRLDADPLLAETENGDLNISVQSADLPVIDDVDGDGDLDILAFSFSFQDRVEFYENFATGNCALTLRRTDRNWGGFKECDCGIIAFNDEECPPPGGRVEENRKTQHVGGKSLALFDVDKDGVKDLLLGHEECSQLYYLPNEGSMDSADFETFQTDFPSPQQPANFERFPAAYFFDEDEDGLMDLLVAANASENLENVIDFRNSNWLYRNTGNGFALEQTDFLQNEMIDEGEDAVPEIIDVDGDGDNDLIISYFGAQQSGNTAGGLALYENVDGKALQFRSSDFLGLRALQLYNLQAHFGDVDGDGATDLVVSGTLEGSFETNLYLLLNQGDFTFDIASIQLLDVPFSFRDNFSLADINRDGKTDLLRGTRFGALDYYSSTGSSFVLEEEAFLGIDDAPGRGNPHGIITDLNRNNNFDLLISDNTGYIRLFLDVENNPLTVGDTLAIEAEGRPWTQQVGSRTWLSAGQLTGNNVPELLVGSIGGGIQFLSIDNLIDLPDPENGLFLQVFPNPATINRTVTLVPNQSCFIQVVALTGQIVMDDLLIPREEETVLSLPGPGMFIIRARNQFGSFSTRIFAR